MARRIIVASIFFFASWLSAAAQEWTQVRAPHFIIATDAGEKKGQEAAFRFEQMRSAFGFLLQRSNISIPLTTEVVAFRSRQELERFSDHSNGSAPEKSGLFLHGQDRQFILLDLSSTDPYAPVLHDFGLMLLEANYPRTQPWFDEGFAQYFAAAQITNKEIAVGGTGQREILNTSAWIPFADLAKMAREPKSDVDRSRQALFNAECWILVHYIFAQHKLAEAGNYFDLAENHGVSAAEAVRRAFGVDAATFLKEVQDYYRAGRAVPERIATPQSLQPDLFVIKRIAPLDAQAVLADLHAHSREHRDAAVAEYEAILKAAPNNSLAYRGLGYIAMEKGDLASASKHFKDALAINAKDPRLLYLAARLLMLRPDPEKIHRSDPAMMESYLVGATNLDGDFAEAWNLLAYARRLQDKVEPAIDAAVNAVKLSPRNERYQQILAQLYVDARQWDNAKYVFTALSWSENAATASEARTMLAGIERAKQTGEKITAGGRPTQSAPQPANEEDKVIDHGIDKATDAPADKPDMRPVKFMRATLAGVSCDGKSAVLNLASSGPAGKGAKTARVRMVKMLVPDIQQVILVNVDTFSCDWRNRQVALNYKEGASPNPVAKAGAYEGDVVSIEMR
jgi:tetratricopeptide (TPR) repeat protein